MKARWVSFLVLLAACIPIFHFRPRSSELLQDTDTAFLLKKLSEYNDPWRWFTHDWPLENRFYRPISTLTFEFDHRLHPGDSFGFGMTQVILCCLATLACGWMIGELTRSRLKGAVGAWIFSIWTTGGWIIGNSIWGVMDLVRWILPILCLYRCIVERKVLWGCLLTSLGAGYLLWLTYPISTRLSGDTLYWLPGRTAITMAIFCFCSVAAFVRFQYGISEVRPESAPSATDLPATRNTVRGCETSSPWVWYGVSFLSAALALGSYEQAVMIPFVLIAVGFWIRTQRFESRFAYQLPFWALLGAYILFRIQIIPPMASGYQKQQFRDGPGLFIDLGDYIFPYLFPLWRTIDMLSLGLVAVLVGGFWSPILGFISNVGAWYAVRKTAVKPVLLILMAALAYGPMAFLKLFGHYHYWPSGFLALLLIEFFGSWSKAAVTAVRPKRFKLRYDRVPHQVRFLVCEVFSVLSESKTDPKRVGSFRDAGTFEDIKQPMLFEHLSRCLLDC